jgi:hypothetical protein
MDSVEFATKYSHKLFKIPRDLFDETVKMFDGYNPHGMLIGYVIGDSERVILELDEFKECGWSLHAGIALTVDLDSCYSDDPSVVAVSYKRLILPKSRGEIHEELKQRKARSQVKPLTAYPNSCKICGAPAKNYDARTMCSNSACSSRNNVLKSIAFKYKKSRPVRCPVKGYDGPKGTCNKVAVFASKVSEPADAYVVDCEVGHSFYLAVKDIKENDLIAYTRAGNDYSDRIWNGKTWETY